MKTYRLDSYNSIGEPVYKRNDGTTCCESYNMKIINGSSWTKVDELLQKIIEEEKRY